MNEENRCSGHCCAVFSLTDPFEKIDTDEWEDRSHEGDKIRNMVIPLDEYEPWKSPGGQTRYFYTCKHFDGQNCTNYENRPLMCSSYPDDQKCVQLGCTLNTDAKTNICTSPDNIARKQYTKLGINLEENNE